MIANNLTQDSYDYLTLDGDKLQGYYLKQWVGYPNIIQHSIYCAVSRSFNFFCKAYLPSTLNIYNGS